ncbi:MAG: hypothetical protein EA388_04515 [Nitriliruptor sp.]|nr:MAG: hypothetical protein EA388_04515 [Nitriliruptor sp.]
MTAPETVTQGDASDAAGGARPIARLGAPATGGLSLPLAHPTAAHLYAPRGVWLDDDRLIATDSGNHRVMIFDGVPTADETPADVILGQPDSTSEGPAAGGRGPANGLHLPTGVIVHDGALYVADAWHHRILVWSSVPSRSDTSPDAVIGQDGLTATQPNRGGEPAMNTLYWPYGLGIAAGHLWVTDTGNRRVLGWALSEGGPVGRSPDVLLGQPDAMSREENRGTEAAADSFRWPHDVAGPDDRLFIADAGNHRVGIWDPPPTADRGADGVLGQPDLTSSTEWPYGPHSASIHRFPYAVSQSGDRLAVADTANNRVLIWDELPTAAGGPAQRVLAQPDFASNGENRWDAVADDTLCWPYGLSLHGSLLAVADSGNNRVMLWELDAAADDRSPADDAATADTLMASTRTVTP